MEISLRKLANAVQKPDEAACAAAAASGMLRTEQTLFLLYGKVRYIVVPNLREMNFGDFEMHSFEELRNRLDYQTWISNYDPSRSCLNGESELEFTSRVTAAAVNPIFQSAVRDETGFRRSG